MTLKALFYAYVIGGLTFVPLVVAAAIFFAIYTSVPLGDDDLSKVRRGKLEARSLETEAENEPKDGETPALDTNDLPRTRKGWLTMRRTFEETNSDGSYVTLVRSFLDARSKDPKKSRPKDMWYVVLKGKVLYLYEDEEMTECEAAVELGGHDVAIYPEGLLDGELFAKRNAICLKPKLTRADEAMPSVTKEMKLDTEDVDVKVDASGGSPKKNEAEREKLLEAQKKQEAARDEALSPATPWFIFVRSNVEMEDWYFALVHASDHPTQTPTLAPLHAVFHPSDMNYLVSTLDEQPDVIPMRWLNALIGRIFFSYYRTHNLEAYIIGRLMKKLSKVKRPTFLTDIVVTEVSVGNKAPTLSKPMLKELTKEGDASLEVHLQYKGEIRITIEATVTINLGARFKSYTVKVVLAAVLKELEGNLLIKVKRPPSNRIWYAFTQTPRMVLEVEPIVSDRQITWGMILSTIESRLKEIIQESVVMPNMDDIAFFESLPYAHRGGIWSDASRRDRPPSEVTEHISEEADSTNTAPPTESTHTEAEDSVPHSQSAEELTNIPTSSSSLPSPEPLATRAATTVPITEDSTGSSKSGRRRSWFSSIRSDDLSGRLAEAFGATDSDDEDDAQRGRTTGSDRAGAPKSHSVSKPRSEVGTDDSHSHQAQSYLSPNAASRSSSQHSSKREHSKTTSVDSTSSNGHLDPDSSASRKSGESARSTGNPPSSPTSFLSTLKSRAGDKEALSKTAKEAMRKWGVNWGNLRKDSNGGSSTNDDMSDHGSIGSSSRKGENMNSIAHMARASYAEVRAAVAERKEKERNSSAEGAESGRSSSPITIPVGGQQRTSRAVSNPLAVPTASLGPTSLPEPVTLSTSTGSSSSGRPSTADRTLSSKRSSPAMSRTNTEADGRGFDASDADTAKIAPVRVQPQAKTMTIPGIHASHRNDVMSMGYVAPQPSPTTPTQNKLTNPGMQSVYRLWKGPASTGTQETQPQQEMSSQPLAQQGTDADQKDESAFVTPPPNVHQSPQTPNKPRLAPPPLPPRTTPVGVSRPPVTQPISSSPEALQPSASDTLKSIATKDENTRTRASLEGINPPVPTQPLSTLDQDGDAVGTTSDISTPVPTPTSNPKPPQLPPRRIPTSA